MGLCGNFADSVCGPFGANSTILPLVKCEEDMTSHLISLGVSSKRGRRSIPTLSESNLILNRAGLFGLGLQRTGEMTICPKHRRELTVDWAGRKSSTCSYPSHRGPRKQMKNVRRINILNIFSIAISASCRTTLYKARNVLYQDAASDKHEEVN